MLASANAKSAATRLHLKQNISSEIAVYWFSPERESLQSLINQSQKKVSGDVRLRLYKGNVIVEGRRSEYSLYSEDLSTFESDSGAYDQRDQDRLGAPFSHRFSVDNYIPPMAITLLVDL